MAQSRFAAPLRRLIEEGELTVELWDGVRAAIRRKIERRGLWERPPGYFGFPEHSAWRDEGALEDAALEFIDTYLRPRIRVEWSARTDEHLERLLSLMIGQFLSERQRRSDPVGHAVYENVVQALRLAVQRGVLRCEASAPSVSDHLYFVVTDERAPRATPGELQARLGALDGWALTVPMLGAAGTAVQELFADLLAEMTRRSPASFRCRDLVVALRDDVRAAVELHLVDPDLGQGTEMDRDGALVRVPVTLPPELADRGGRLIPRLRDAVERLRCQKRVKVALLKLLEHLADGDEPPTRRELMRRLGVPRSTLSELMARLAAVARAIDPDGGGENPLGSSGANARRPGERSSR
jgi:hypothetical protein